MGKALFAIGEALIDFLPAQSGVAFAEVSSFAPQVGGAPANVCGAFSRLGGCSFLLTQLGNDPFGKKIVTELADFGVGIQYISTTDEANTALAFVSLDDSGDRTFAFYRKPSADMLYRPEQLQDEWFTEAYALHFCSVALVTESMRLAHKKAIRAARAAGALISFDPNLRFPLWQDQNELYRVVQEYLPTADIIKISAEELEFIAGTDQIEIALDKLFVGNVKLIIYTCGAGISSVFTRKAQASVTAEKVTAVDTTGAGDGFIGAFLYRLFQAGITPGQLDELKTAQLTEMLAFANRFCAKSVQKKGAIASYPTLADLE